MGRRCVSLAAVLCLLFLPAQPLWADDLNDLKEEVAALKAKLAEMDALKARVAELEKKLEDQGCAVASQGMTVAQIKESLIQYKPGEGLTVPPCGIEITAGATFVGQGTTRANNAGDNAASRFDASWSSDIFIQKAFDDWGLALIHLEPGENDTLETELAVFSNVNRDANATGANVPVTELWYEHYLFNKQIAITAGKLDASNCLDQNEFAHDETTQFLGRIFKMNPAIEWPDDNTFGGRLLVAPDILPFMSVESAYFDANNDWENVFDTPFFSTQLNLKPSKIFGFDEGQWDGNIRTYWWMDGRDHAKFFRAGEQPDEAQKTNAGFGVSLDQMLTDVFGVFGRFGWQRPDLILVSANPNSANVETFWSAGLQMTGTYWNRPDDLLACGIGQLFTSDFYKDAGNPGGVEGHLEAYYKIKVNEHLAISPDLQVIWNPMGVDHYYLGQDDTIFVYGVRGQIDF